MIGMQRSLAISRRSLVATGLAAAIAPRGRSRTNSTSSSSEPEPRAMTRRAKQGAPHHDRGARACRRARLHRYARRRIIRRRRARFIHWAEPIRGAQIAKEVSVVAERRGHEHGMARLSRRTIAARRRARAQASARFRLSRSGGGAMIAGGATLAGERAVREAASDPEEIRLSSGGRDAPAIPLRRSRPGDGLSEIAVFRPSQIMIRTSAFPESHVK